MERIIVTDHDVRNDGRTCQYEALSKVIADAPDNCEIFFPSGRYYVTKAVPVVGKTGVTLRGETGTVLLTHFTPWNDPAENNGGVRLPRLP